MWVAVISVLTTVGVKSRRTFSYMTCHNYAVADLSSFGHVIVKRHVGKKDHLDLTPTVVFYM